MNQHLYRVVDHHQTGTPTAVAEHTRSRHRSAADNRSSKQQLWVLPFPSPINTSLTRLALGIALSCGGIHLVHAQSGPIQADPHANGIHRPVVDNTANGLPLVQIAAPNSSGLSHNQYQQFNVDQRGAILNNASGSVNTQLGGWVGGNPNLREGGARIILNEVTSGNTSHLRGYLEVAGQRAEVIIANPNGISCNGCGFINTSRGVLTTGTPVFGGSGSLEAFRVTQGAVQIGADGFNDSATTQVDLIARSVQVNGELYANALHVVTGANQVRYADLGVQVIAGSGAVPTVAIDLAALGGMYANKIKLIGTEAGVGVVSYGNMAAAGEFTLDAAGKVTLVGDTRAGGKLQLASRDSIVNQASLSAGGDLALHAATVIDNRGGQLLAGGNLTLDSASLDNSGGVIEANGNTSLALRSDYTHAKDDRLGSGGDLHISTTGDFNNHNTVSAGGNLQVSAANIDNHQDGVFSAGQTAWLQAEHTITNSGRLYGEDVALDAHTLINGLAADDGTPAAVIAARNRLDIGAQQIINREHALLQSEGDMTIGASLDAELRATGSAESIINSAATIASGSDLAITSAALVNTNAHFASEIQDDPSQTRSWTEYEIDGASQIYRDHEVSIRNEDNIDKLVVNANGARHNDYTTRRITETTSRTVVTHTDPGNILARGDINLQGGSVSNDKSAIVAGGDLRGELDGLSNGGSNPQGEILVHLDITSIHHTTERCSGGTKRCNKEDVSHPQIDLPATHFDLGIWRADAHSDPDSLPNPAMGKLPEIAWLPDNALFQAVNTPDLRYLIATDPAFTGYRRYLSSDYLLSRLSLDPHALQKRLGDGYYEQKLINDQILQLTGRKTLGAYASNEEQYRALMEAGVAYAEAFELVPGMALSAAQMAALTSDMVWLVEQTVALADGSTQQVLAPVLYLSQIHAQDIAPTGALMGAAHIDLQLNGSLDNAATLRADGNLRIAAGEDINNRLGTITGANAVLTAGRDINNQSGTLNGEQLGLLAQRDINLATVANTTAGAAGTQISLDRTGSIQAGTLTIQAQRDIHLDAATISASGDASLVAGNQLNLNAVNSQAELNVTYDDRNHLYKRQEQANGTSISSGGNTTLVAGNDINSHAAYVNADKDLTIVAGGNVNISVATQTSSYDQEVQTASSGGLASHSVHSRDQQTGTQAIGSTFSADKVIVQSGKDINIVGSNVVSTSGTDLAAVADINIVSSQDSASQTYAKQEKTSGLFSGGGIGVTVGSRTLENAQTSKQLSNNASTVGSTEGNVNIRAGQTYTQTGSTIVTPAGDIAIAAQRVDINAAFDTVDSTQDTRFSQTGITLQLTNPIIDAIQSVQQLKRASAQTKDKRMQGLAAGAAALTVANTAAQVDSGAAPAGGIDLAISIGASRSQSHSEQHSTTALGSTMAAGGNLSINASGAGADSNLSVIGSDIHAGGNIALAADNQINLLASVDTDEQRSSNSSSAASVGISFGSNGFRVNASASGSRGKGDGSDLAYNNSHVDAGGELSMQSGGDTAMRGAVVSGEQVSVEVGGNLSIASLQDSSHYNSRQQSLGGSISIGTGVSGSINASRSKVDGNYVSVQEQSGIKAGDGGFAVNVNGNTDLKGSQIASTEQAVQDDKNSFSSGSLSMSELHNQSDYHAESLSISVGAGNGSMKGTGVGFGNASGSDSSTTTAGISGIAGDNSVRSDQDSSAALTKNWDGQQLQQDVEAQAKITEAFGKQAALGIGTYATSKLNELDRQIKEENDPQKKAQLQSEADNWKEGGAYRTALHAAAGALTGGLAGAAGATAAAVAMPVIADQIEKLDVPNAVKQGLAQVAASALGAAVGGTAGAAAAVNTEANNRQLHQSEKELIAKKENGDNDVEERLTKAACYVVKCWAEYPENSKEYEANFVDVMDAYALKDELAWVTAQQEKGQFVYTTGQQFADYVKNDLKGNVLPAAANTLKVVTGGLSAATGYSICSTTGVGCVAGFPMIMFGLSNVTDGSTGLYNQYQGYGTTGTNPMRNSLNQMIPGGWGNTVYTGLDFGIGILAMRVQIPLNVGLADGLGRSQSMFGVTVPRINNPMLLPLTKLPLPVGTGAVVLTTGAIVKGGEFAKEAYEAGKNE